jgi:hypothetical protein
MKRLVLAIASAATLAGTGCGSHPCQRNVTVDWSQGFLRADGATLGCGGANVQFVDLFINDDPSTGTRVDCSVLAMQAVDVGTGTNLFTVEGIGPGGRIAYRKEFQLAAACGDQQVAVTPAQGVLHVAYSFSPSNSCYPGTTYLWSQVRDDVAGQIDFTDTDQSAANTCPAALAFVLPEGPHTLLGINEWSPTAGYVGADCTDRPFDIAGAQDTTVSPVLVDSSAACF